MVTLRLTGLGSFYATKLCGVEKHKDCMLTICAWYYFAKDARNDLSLLAGSLPAKKRTFWRD